MPPRWTPALVSLLLAASPSLADPPPAPPLEWRAALGGQIDHDPHGIGDYGLRKGAFSAQLLSDTIDLRYAPETAHGRWWIGARGEVLIAGLLISPWSNGGPDPGRALFASYAGLDGGWIRYLGALYAGVQASGRIYFFNAYPSAHVPVPGPTTLFTLEGVVGRWTPDAHLWLRAGADLQNESLSPHVSGEAIYHPSFTVAPRLELRAGWARNQTDLTRTRLGGMNPYVVPLAGAAWAEWWVENYVAARAGLVWQTKYTEVGATVDSAAFDGTIVTGFALHGRLRVRRYFAETSVGWAPWIPRQPDVGRVSLWIAIGADWGAFRKK